MTREEVTKHLNILLANRCWDCRERAGSKVCDEKCMFKQAFNEAIEALSEDISEDGTLKVKVKDGSKVNRVLVWGDNTFGGLYYPDREDGEEE